MSRALRSSNWLCRGMVLAMVTLAAPIYGQVIGRPANNPDLEKKFNDRVSAYVKLRDAQKSGEASQKQSSSPEKVVSEQRELSRKIRQARTGAQPGNVFSHEIATYLRAQIASAFQGPDGEKAAKSLAHAEPVPGLEVGVNKGYPAVAPLQSMPATLLEALPRLPQGLEYRFAGDTLLLYDSESNLIVDYMKQALPK